MEYMGFFILVNSVAFFMFAEDKARSMARAYRIPEVRLLMLAAAGGSVGAVLAQRCIRHKTRKQPFADMLLLIIGLQLGAVFGLGALYLALDPHDMVRSVASAPAKMATAYGSGPSLHRPG